MQLGAQIVLSGIQLVLAGIVIGVLMAAPIGPVNILCIQRAVSRGFWGGLAAGLGAVLGDGTLAAIAAFSMTAISEGMLAYAAPIQFAGGLVLIGFGVALLLKRPVLRILPEQESRLWEHTGVIPQTYFLTVTNPGAALGMIVIFGELGSLIGGLNYFEALLLVLSVMGGSLLWWLGLSRLIATIRHKLTEQRLKLINRAAGTVLLAFGLILVLEGLLRQLR
ncbi:MAG: LysE family translocator [Methyloceanibacter sp.]